jgi:hypothetical protein
MHVLFLALTIYLIGTTLVLYLRPATMFHPGGAWKEFSLTPDPNHTYMPFWLFSILWAFFSYLLATFIQRMAGPSVPSEDVDFEKIELPETRPVEENNEIDVDAEDLPELAEPVSKNMGLNRTRNGYYVLNTEKYNRNRVPMYVYYGDSPPPDVGSRQQGPRGRR